MLESRLTQKVANISCWKSSTKDIKDHRILYIKTFKNYREFLEDLISKDNKIWLLPNISDCHPKIFDTSKFRKLFVKFAIWLWKICSLHISKPQRGYLVIKGHFYTAWLTNNPCGNSMKWAFSCFQGQVYYQINNRIMCPYLHHRVGQLGLKISVGW